MVCRVQIAACHLGRNAQSTMDDPSLAILPFVLIQGPPGTALMPLGAHAGQPGSALPSAKSYATCLCMTCNLCCMMHMVATSSTCDMCANTGSVVS